MSYNFNLIEEKWRKRWEEEHIFEPKIGDKKYLITVPWPYCNGALHIGHGRTYTTADIIARYKRMKGFNVLYPMAFHISGTPILAFSKKIENGDTQTIDLYREYLSLYGDNPDIVKEFSEPENIAAYFSTKIVSDFKNMGLSIDWTRIFNSGEPIYNKFVEWQFSILKEKELLKQGDYPILYSPSEGNPVGEDDILEGDTNKVSITQFTAVFFSLGKEILLASTVRPETLIGVTNLFINPESEYCKIRMDNNTFILSKRGYEKLKFQRQVEFLTDVKGSDLIGKKAREPLGSKEIPILKGYFVDPEIGTGIDYSVPAHSVWDHVALLESSEKLEYIRVIDTGNKDLETENIRKKFNVQSLKDRKALDEATKYLYEQEFYHGKITVGKYTGNIVKDVKDKIVADLISGGGAIPFFETSRKAETRDGDSVIVAVIKNQWFIDYSIPEWKEEVRKLIDRMDFKPEMLKNQFLQTVDWIRERPCARRRGLGTRLPVDKDWIIESLSDSTIYTAIYTVISYLKKINLAEIDRDLFDFIFLDKGNLGNKSEKTRVTAIDARKEFLYWYPVDLRHTSYPHISNHLTFYLFNHVAIFPEDKWPIGISTGGTLLFKGQKMSKSKGNVLPLITVKQKYGADLFRLYLSSNADVWADVYWTENEVDNYSKKLERFLQITKDAIESKGNPDERDFWLLSRMAERIRKASQSYDSMKIREAAVELFFNTLNDLRDLENFAGRERMLNVVRVLAKEWALSLSPIIPYLAEETYSLYGGKGFASIQPYPEPGRSYEKEGKEWLFVQSVVEDFRKIVKVSKITPKRMIINTAEDWKWKILDRMKKEQFKEIMKTATEEEREFTLTQSRKDSIEPILRQEEEVLKKYKDDLSGFLKVEIVINGIQPNEKMKRASPGKPSIMLE